MNAKLPADPSLRTYNESVRTKENLLAAARALDEGSFDRAREYLQSLLFIPKAVPDGLIALALWRRLLKNDHELDAKGVLTAFERLAAAASDIGKMWNAYDVIPVLEENLGADQTAAIVASILWDCVLKSESTLFERAFDLFFRADNNRCILAMEQYLASQRNFNPTYWQFVLLTRGVLTRSGEDLITMIAALSRNSNRDDLTQLFDIYLMQMRQAPVAEILANARRLPSPAQRSLVLQYIANMSYTRDDLQHVVRAFPQLAVNTEEDKLAIDFIKARLAIAEGRWRDVIKLTERLRNNREYRHNSNLLFSLAAARLKDYDVAGAALHDVRSSPEASSYARSRAVFINITTEMIRRDLPLPETKQLELAPAVGRPLVQSLWVGRKLRWIERLCIKSYLESGWRFQLYVYDEPDNVPEGCEVLDASVIIPTKNIFVEGRGSAQHMGSIGAFSDLFRYRLLQKRGGIWTDTDVINRKTYDADGRKFVSTELTDAGLITINGAIMAAPAGDKFVSDCYARANELLSSDSMFFTRIGPYLLGEMILESGVESIEIMPLGFLGPVAWMNVASLLQPFENVMARPEFQQAVNIHVYTEMWRTLGLGLDRPADKSTFIGRLYHDYFGE